MHHAAFGPAAESAASYSVSDTQAALPSAFSGASGGAPRITLNAGEVFINGTHANNTASVSVLTNQTIRVTLVGIDTRDFDISDVDSIRFVGRKGHDVFTSESDIPIFAFGNEGSDEISGGLGDDFLHGGFGDDLINGREGDDTIVGDLGADILYGNQGNDEIHGGRDDDDMYGGSGDDFLSGAMGDDRVFGNSGNDLVTGDTGDDRVHGQLGNDQVYGWFGNDILWGGGGADIIVGYNGHDLIFGGSGDDWIHGGQQDDSIEGEQGNDLVRGGPGNDLLGGGPGDDKLYGQDGSDRVDGDAGHDLVRGGKQADWMTGGYGNDILYGDDGEDTLIGFNGLDYLYGGGNQDVLIGGVDVAADRLNGNGGQDHILAFFGDVVTSDSQDLHLVFKNQGFGWNVSEMLVINDALHKLHDATGNNALVQDYITGDELTIAKVASLPGGAAALNEMTYQTKNGVTTYHRVIKIAEWNETSESQNDLREIAFLHEIAHNFDHDFELAANPHFSPSDFDDFKALSNWRRNKLNEHFLPSQDGEWWYHKNTQFYRSYSNFNPMEDWATIWELYFDEMADPPSPTSNLGEKLAFVTSFINQLA